MTKLCERPGCSDPGSIAYGMVTEDLLFWLGPIDSVEHRVLCTRHADAMVVPRGWTLDDRREADLHLFSSGRFRTSDDMVAATASAAAAALGQRGERAHRPRSSAATEQLQIDGTGELPRPVPSAARPDDSPPRRADNDGNDDVNGNANGTDNDVANGDDGTGDRQAAAPPVEREATSDPRGCAPAADVVEPWTPRFDDGDDLDGLLTANSPLLSRAFNGRRRPRRP